jgi:hypothetical protein
MTKAISGSPARASGDLDPGVILVFLLALGVGGMVYTHYHVHHTSAELDRAITAQYAVRMARLGVEAITIDETNMERYARAKDCKVDNTRLQVSGRYIQAYVPASIPNFVYLTTKLSRGDSGLAVVTTDYQGTSFRPDAPQPTEAEAEAAVSAEIDHILSSLESHSDLCPKTLAI